MGSDRLKALPGDEVHIYRAELDQPDSLIEELRSILSPDEQERADRFRFEQDKKRFIACRGILRTILSGYLGINPGCVEFEYGAHGKPMVKAQPDTEKLRFSLSHSHNLAVHAVASDREIGVDVEYIRRVSGADRIVDRYFTAPESAIYRSLAPDEKQEAFFNVWTCKEAYLKAIGVGLGRPLSSVEVSIAPGEVPRLLMIEEGQAIASGWSLRLFKPERGYVAALAVEGSCCQLRFWEYASELPPL